MNLFLILFFQFAFVNQPNQIPNCYSEFSILHWNYNRIISREFPHGVNYESIRCNKRERKFKLADYYKVNYLNFLNQDSIIIEIFKSKHEGFEECSINAMLEHVNGNKNTKWDTPLSILNVGGLKIYVISPSKVMESKSGKAYVFFKDSKTLIRILLSPEKESEFEKDNKFQEENFVRLYINHINSCEK